MVKSLPVMQETGVRSLGQEDPLEKGIATHSSMRAWNGTAELDSTEQLTLSHVIYMVVHISVYSFSHCVINIFLQ